MASSDNEVRMMMSVYPGAMTGFAAMNAGLSSILNVFNGMTRAFDQQFGLVDAALTTTSVVVTQLGVDAMNAFGQFEQGMKIVQMVSGQTASDMDYLKQKANEFSVEYRTDIDQITEGLQTLGRAGLNTASEQAEVLENGLTTAKLEGRELNGVLQELIQNTALLGGDLKSNEFGEDSQYVNDLLVATSMTAPITTHDISETLKYSGGIAAAAGAKIRTDTGEMNEQGKAILEDYMGTIAAFAQKGVTGSIAGTALRAFLNKPATQDSSVTDALASIHLKPEYLWEDGEEVMKPISQQIAIIQNQMDELNVSTMDRLQIWSKIVGGKMGQQMMKLDSEDIKEITKDIQAADNAENLAANSMKTYEANVKAAKESVAGLQRNVGEKLVFLANPWLEMINKVLEFFNNDITGSALAGSIIAFVGYLFGQIRRIAGVIKGEISSLLSMTKDARALIHQSMTGRAQLDESKVGDFSAMKSTYSSKAKVREAAIIAGTKTAESYDAFNKEYAKTIANLSPLSYKSLKEGGVVGDRMAVVASLQKMTTTDKFGIKDQDYVAAGMLTKTLPKGMEEELINARKSGLGGRALLTSVIGKSDSAEFEKFRAHIRSVSENLKILGLTAEQVTTELQASTSNAASGSGKFRYGSWHDSGRQQRTQTLIENNALRVAREEEVVAQNAAAKAAEAHVIALSGDTTAEERAEESTLALERAFNAYTPAAQRFAQAIKTSSISPQGSLNPLGINNNFVNGDVLAKWLYGNNKTILPGFVNTSLSHHELTNSYIPFNTTNRSFAGDIERNIKLDNLRAYDLMLMQQRGDALYNRPSSVLGEGNSAVTRIDKALMEKRLQPAFDEINRGMATYMNNVVHKSMGQYLSSNVGSVGAGALSNIPRNFDLLYPPVLHKPNEIVPYTGQQGGIEEQKRQIILQENLAVEEQIKQELLTIANYLKKQEMVKQLRDDTAKAEKKALENVQNREARYKNLGSVIDKAKAANTALEERQQYQQEVAKARNALNTAGTGYPTRMSTSSSSQVHIGAIPFVDEKAVLESKKQQEFQSKVQKRINKLHEVQAARLERENAEREAAYQRQSMRQSYYTLGEDQRKAIASAEFDDLKRMNSLRNRISGVPGYITNSGFVGNLSNRLNRDRTGSFLSFGKEWDKNAKVYRSATKGVSGLANKALNASEAIGGPFMIAMMAIPAIINMIKGQFEEFCNDLKEAQNQLKEAYSTRSSAEDALEQTYREQNPDATPEDIEGFVLDTYAQLYEDRQKNTENWAKTTADYITDSTKYKQYEYDTEKDDGSYKEKEKEESTYEDAVRKNTSALYSATAQLDIAMNKLTTTMNNSVWGMDGISTKVTDIFGYMQDRMFNKDGTTFTDTGSFLLTASQKDENYPGSKELAGLMLEDFHDANGDWVEGLTTLYGKDADFLKNVMNSSAREFLGGGGKPGKGMAQFASRLSPQSRGMLQASMMNDKKTWQSLAKEIFKYESKNKKSVGAQETTNKRMENLIKKLQIDTRLNRMQIIQAAYYQQLQDMYSVMEQVFTPIMAEQSMLIAQNLLGTSNIDNSSRSISGTSYGTESIASVISANVALIAKSKAAEAVFNEALSLDPNDPDPNKRHLYELARDSDDANAFYKKAMAESYGTGLFSTIGKMAQATYGVLPLDAVSAGMKLDEKFGTYTGGNKYAAQEIATVYRALAQVMNNPGMSIETARELSEGVIKNDNRKMNDIFTDIGKMYSSPAIIDQIQAAYGASDIGEPSTEGSGSGGGGSGSGDKDKDTGTKKERVDLVLCNKKEIPKLNVNLFKKAPSFTILNKNFKLRDIKVNTQDKPKAVLASIKNAIIDVQKRTDPKIIQDEQAEYDPVAATDGNQTPSGSTGTTTDE